jgi:hypothetical protein
LLDGVLIKKEAPATIVNPSNTNQPKLQEPNTNIQPPIAKADTSSQPVLDSAAKSPNNIQSSFNDLDLYNSSYTNLLETDKQNIITIRKKFVAEENEDFDAMYNCLSPSMTKYASTQNPSKEFLEQEYLKAWSKSSNRKYFDVKLTKLTSNTYRVKGKLSFYSIKDQLDKTVNFDARYIFDEQNLLLVDEKY